MPNDALAAAAVPGTGVLWAWSTNAGGMLAGPYSAQT
jgi:hypothetical protein